MKKTVTLEQKKHFVEYLIRTCKLDGRGDRILRLAFRNPVFLKKVKFVEDASENNGAGLFLTSEDYLYQTCLFQGSKTIPFSRVSDVLTQYSKISVEVEFQDKENCQEYLDVLECFTPATNEEASKKISDLIEKNMQLNRIRDKIDDALDRGSEEDFMKFTKIMIEIKKELKE